MPARPSRATVRGIGAVAIAVVIARTPSASQPPQTPPRDRPQIQQTWTGRIKGRVVDAQTGSAVARARVRIMGGPGNRPLVLTDDTGAFEFAELPPGAFFLSADRPGYITARYPEQARTMRGNRPLTVTDGQTVTGITLPMSRGAAITGRVVDAHGDPVEYSQIQVLRLPASGRGAPQQRGGGASTNDLGEFRIAKLEPGAYVLLAVHRNMQPDDPADLQPLPTYFPGVVSLDQAQPITVERNQTVSGIDLMMLEASSSVVSGTVVDAKGQPVTGGSLQVRHVTSEYRDFGAFGGMIRPDGTFKLKLAPGEYEIEVRGMRPGVVNSMQSSDELVGLARVSVAGAPLSDLTIQLTGGAVVTGKVVFEGESPLPPDATQLRIGLNSMRDAMCRSGRFEMAADWTFRIDGAYGTCMMPQAGIGRWTMKSVMHNDVNVIDQPLRIAPGQRLRDVQVVMTDRRCELTLQVTDEHGVATREYVALAFTHDKTKWMTETARYMRPYVPPPALPASSAPAPGRATPGAAPNGSATVAAARERPDSIVGLPPGDYYVVAVDDLPIEGFREPSVLESLIADAVTVTVTDTSPAQVSLKRRAFRLR